VINTKYFILVQLLILKILLFYKKILKQKSPSARAKGLGMSGSLYWTRSELLREI